MGKKQTGKNIHRIYCRMSEYFIYKKIIQIVIKWDLISN